MPKPLLRLPQRLLALLLVAFFRTAIFFLPFTALSRWLTLSGEPHKPASASDALQISHDLYSVAKYFPFICNCFSLSAAGMTLCRWSGLPSKLYFGIARNDAGRLIAHAWLKYEDVFITDQRGYEKFTVVKIFEWGHIITPIEDAKL